jgi:hypothetical protein
MSTLAIRRNIQADLGHGIKQRSSNALFMRQRELADKERAGGENEVGAHDAEHGGAERISPVRHAGVDHGEQDTCKRGGCRTTAYDTNIVNQIIETKGRKEKRKDTYLPATQWVHALPLTPQMHYTPTH